MSDKNIFKQAFINKMLQGNFIKKRELELITILIKEYKGKASKKDLKEHIVNDLGYYGASQFSNIITALVNEKLLFDLNDYLFCNPMYIDIKMENSDILIKMNELL